MAEMAQFDAEHPGFVGNDKDNTDLVKKNTGLVKNKSFLPLPMTTPILMTMTRKRQCHLLVMMTLY